MITNVVTKWRKAKRVSKAHMARRIGVKRSYMTKLEQGRLQPSGEMMFEIAEYLGQPLEQVFQHVKAAAPAPIFAASNDAY
jgi:putative transcriptional regulator